MKQHPTDFFSFTTGKTTNIAPQQAILIHQFSLESNRANPLVASLHDFVEGTGGEPVIGAGHLMSKQDIEGLLKTMLQLGNSDAVVLPANIVSVSPTHLAWVVAANVRSMLFNMLGKPIQKLIVPWPRLLLVATRSGHLAVAALKARTRPKPNTPLYRAPLMNVSDNGSVCTGNATLPASVEISDMAQWEAVLFDTAFSHVNNQRSLDMKHKANVDTAAHFRFWNLLSRNKTATFPGENLHLQGMNVAEFIQRHAR